MQVLLLLSDSPRMKIDLYDLPTTPPKNIDKKEVLEKLEDILEEIEEYQRKLFAQGEQSLLIILQ